MIELNQKQFTNQIITNLRTIDGLNNVTGSYPEGNSTFPIATVSTVNTPITYDFGKNELKVIITCDVQLWDSKQTSVMDIMQLIESNMIAYGFTRNNPTSIYKDNQINKFTCSEAFRIVFNKMNGKFERSI